MKFEEFVSKVDDTFMNHQASRSGGKISAANQWRYGQVLMNVLHDVWHKKYLEISDSDLGGTISFKAINNQFLLKE